MTNLRVGMKVTLVRSFGVLSTARAAEEGVFLPQKGEVYTIRAFDPDEAAFLCIWLSEITNKPCAEDGIEPSFQASLFRPVIERKTDISALTALLNTSKSPVLA